MSEFTEAIAWDGVHVTLTVFVVHDSGRRVALSVPVGLTQPGRVSYYPLEEDDEDRVLGALSPRTSARSLPESSEGSSSTGFRSLVRLRGLVLVRPPAVGRCSQAGLCRCRRGGRSPRHRRPDPLQRGVVRPGDLPGSAAHWRTAMSTHEAGSRYHLPATGRAGGSCERTRSRTRTQAGRSPASR